MSLNCTEIKNIFVEKQKKGGASHLEDYEYCRLLYENAKGNARRKSLERNSAEHKQESKFNNIHLFLRELEDSGAFEEEEEWGSSSSASGDYYDLCYSGGAASGLSYEELARARPGLVQQLRSRVASLLSSLAPPDTPAWSVRGNPQHFNSVWSPGWC